MLSCFSHIRLFRNRWTVACQVPLSMGFSRQKYWSGLPCLPPGDLPDLGIEPTSLMSPELTGRLLTTSTTWEIQCSYVYLVALGSLWPHGLQPTRLLCPWGFSRQEYWSVLSCSPPGDLPNSGIEPRSPTLWADSLPREPPGKPNVSVDPSK